MISICIGDIRKGAEVRFAKSKFVSIAESMFVRPPEKSHALEHRSLLNLFDSLLQATKIDDWKYVRGEKKIPS